MTQVIGIDASHDSATRVVSRHRRKNVYPHFVAKGFAVKRFSGKRARRDLVQAAVKDAQVQYITGVGHGLYNSYLGHADAPVFQVGQFSVEECNAKIVHFLSCLTALSLGPSLVSNGSRAFFGYDDYFTFNDKSRDAMLHCDSEIDRGFADGLTAHEVYQRTIDAFDAAIAEAKRTTKLYRASLLEFNRDHLCAPSVDGRFGAPNARLARPSR